MKKGVVILSILFIFSLCKAQQEIVYTQYIFSPLVVNPAYAGNQVDLNVTALSRKQWIGLDGSPTTISVFADGSLLGHNTTKDRHLRPDKRFYAFSDNKEIGLGLILFNDRVGVNNTFRANMAYSYKIKFSSYTRLSFGLQMGVLNFNQSVDKLENIDPNDEVFQENINVTRFNIGFGTFFETEHYFLSLSIPSIIKNNIDPINNDETLLRQYFFSAGYLIYLHPQYKLKPTLMVRYTEEFPAQFDINVHLLYNDRIWTGISYRYKNSINISSEILISQSFSAGLAYDIAFGEIGKISRGSAEILISYTFRQPQKRIVNPRYF